MISRPYEKCGLDAPNLVRRQSHTMHGLIAFLAHWAFLTVLLWAASHVFKGITYTSPGALWVAALLLGLVNAVVRPILVILTLPLTILTLGLFLLVINALMMMLVSAIVRGFEVKGFWTAFFASIFIAILSFLLDAAFFGGSTLTLSAPVGTQI
jgi:putative membrane protein